MRTAAAFAAMALQDGMLGFQVEAPGLHCDVGGNVRRRKPAAARRAQRLRADGRAATRLAAQLAAVAAHRGGKLTKMGMAILTALGADWPAAAADAGAPPSAAAAAAAAPPSTHEKPAASSSVGPSGGLGDEAYSLALGAELPTAAADAAAPPSAAAAAAAAPPLTQETPAASSSAGAAGGLGDGTTLAHRVDAIHRMVGEMHNVMMPGHCLCLAWLASLPASARTGTPVARDGFDGVEPASKEPMLEECFLWRLCCFPRAR